MPEAGNLQVSDAEAGYLKAIVIQTQAGRSEAEKNLTVETAEDARFWETGFVPLRLAFSVLCNLSGNVAGA